MRVALITTVSKYVKAVSTSSTYRLRAFICVLFLLLTGCVSAKTDLPAGTPLDGSVPQTATANVPTNIPPPTTTSTPEPTPLNFSGTGDSSMDVSSWPHQPGVISYSGQSGKGFFAIVPYDEKGSPMSSICTVNTFDPYKGSCLFNADGQYATRLETKTTGNWVIKINPLSQARTLLVPGSIEGNGNEVIVLSGGIPVQAAITGNKEKQLFSLIPYTADGKRMISLVNTTDSYQDTVSIHGNTAILEVLATGSWSIAITSK
jgi:hypothetical protein